MQHEFIAMLDAPSRETYLACYARVIAAPGYSPYSSEYDSAHRMYEQEEFEQAKALLFGAMYHLALSPRVHWLLSSIACQLGDERAAKLEGSIAIQCLTAILASGEGDKTSPYLVARTSDEHDVLDFLDKQLEEQALLNEGDRHLDRIRCVDGTELWFDITDAFNSLASAFEA